MPDVRSLAAVAAVGRSVDPAGSEVATAEPVPETAEPTLPAAEPRPDTVDPAPGTAEPTPETVEPTPETVEPRPESTVESGDWPGDDAGATTAAGEDGTAAVAGDAGDGSVGRGACADRALPVDLAGDGDEVRSPLVERAAATGADEDLVASAGACDAGALPESFTGSESLGALDVCSTPAALVGVTPPSRSVKARIAAGETPVPSSAPPST
ncbi:MAG: hypothetical protein ACRDL8_12375, partial [Solirubrobacteraceae bacterium]